jgi:hypothetical protein
VSSSDACSVIVANIAEAVRPRGGLGHCESRLFNCRKRSMFPWGGWWVADRWIVERSGGKLHGNG